MSAIFNIEFDWLENNSADEISRCFSAAIGLSLDGQYLTQIEDFAAKTVRNQVRGSAWHLALWFATNWWRLRWEPETENIYRNCDWCVSHGVAGAGGGVVWPHAYFVSDGNGVEISMAPKNQTPAFEPVRYMHAIRGRVAAGEFENQAGQFINAVLSRAQTFKIADKSLHEVWSAVQSERMSAEASAQRKMEALAGYDPDCAPESLLRLLLSGIPQFGKTAFEEIVADARENTEEVVTGMREIAKGGARITMPNVDMSPVRKSTGDEPWKQGAVLAHELRKRLDLKDGPVTNENLSDMVRTKAAFLTGSDGFVSNSRMPFVLREDDPDTYQFFINRKRGTTRRFALARMIGDHLAFRNDEPLRPATKTRTFRQKLQRAFAQELLCPTQELIDKVGTGATDDEAINDAAEFFDVSPLLVKNTLVNNRVLDREILGAQWMQ